MKRHITQLGILVSILALCLIGSPASVHAAAEENHILIATVVPEMPDGASKESVELYNPGATSVDISGWRLQYRSANYKSGDGGGWSTRAIMGCQSTKQADCDAPRSVSIKKHEVLRLSSYETGEGIMPLATGMATAGGVLRLITDDDKPIIHDKVGYGTAKDFEGKAAAPEPIQGIVRKTQDAQPIDTNDNAADFELEVTEADDPETPDSEPDKGEPVEPGKGSSDEPLPSPKTYLDVEISELLPDPASPQTDSDDEFIELYNPHDKPVDLTDYMLVTGSSWASKYTIKDLELPPYGYVALSSAQTHIALSNTGTGVRLYDPEGKQLAEVPHYGKAKPGQSWLRNEKGEWVWTTKSTPDTQNIVELPPVPPPKPAAVTAPKKKTAAASASKTSTPTAKKASTPKTSAVKVATTASTPPPSQPDNKPAQNNHTGLWVLVIAGTLAVGYALFEYRHDISGFIRRRWEALTMRGQK